MSIRPSLAACCIASAALSACMSLQGPAPQPAAPLASSYPRGDEAAAELPAWRDYFVADELRGLIEQALSNNRDLRVTLARVEQARAAYGLQRAAQFPVVGVQASNSRSLTPADLNLTRRPLVAGDVQIGLGLSNWEIDFWGRLGLLKDAALESFLAADEQRRAFTLSLIAQVADGYVQLRSLDDRLALARQTVASRRETLKIFSRREAVGAVSRLSVTQVETLLTQAEALQVQLEQQREAQWQALQLLVGEVPRLRTEAVPLDDAALMASLRPGLPSQLLQRRPDLLAADHKLRAAHANVGAARAAFFPQVQLTAAFGTASAELGGLFDRGSRAWQFAPSISLPIFDGGRREQNLSLETLRRDEAVAQYERTVQQAFKDVADALAARQSFADQLEIADRALASQKERARLAKLRYDSGAAPYLEVLDAERDLLTAEQQRAQVRGALLSSRVALFAALGGGAPEAATAVAAPAAPSTSSTH
ncbi:MAG: RND transporter [Roseateles depolymerans]|uniref:RND transporter n=1 Tax=Roseateles depolymerans TaxID=76731 RepID=A0A2W5FKZ1_9BURK|nr:MAG: RND transporter [Roseateles depolymerans]